MRGSHPSEPIPDKPRIAGGFYMEQTALANRLCRPSLLHLEPTRSRRAFPPPPPNVQTQPVAQEPLDEGILLGVFVAGTREPVTIPNELPGRVFSKWREISHGFGL